MNNIKNKKFEKDNPLTMIAHDLSNSKRSNDVKTKSGKSKDFDSFLLSAVVLKGLKECGFVRPSPIQVEAIPLAKCGIGTCFILLNLFVILISKKI